MPSSPRRFTDIRPPRLGEREGSVKSARLARTAAKTARRKGTPRIEGRIVRRIVVRRVVVLVVLVGLVGGGIMAAGVYRERQVAVRSASRSVEELTDVLAPLRALKGDNVGLPSPFGDAAPFGGTVDEVWRTLTSLFRDAGTAYEGLNELSLGAFTMIERLDSLGTQVFDLALGSSGDTTLLLDDLTALRESFASMRAVSNRLASLSITDNALLPFGIQESDPLSLWFDVEQTDALLGSLIDWLGGERRLVVFFQNTSEVRPTGGFWGSYADVTLTNGVVVDAQVHDITTPDETLDLEVVPPKPLWAITEQWTAADANWFFDFSESAERALTFLEASSFYGEEGVRFDGALAVSPRVVEDILSLTGPIVLEEHGLTLDADSFLYTLQSYIDGRRDVGDESPKAVLDEAAAALKERVEALPGADKQVLRERVFDWFRDRDIMVYVRDGALQASLEAYRIAGRPYLLPHNFNGDYLAVTNANVGGGKSDAFITQEVILKSTVGNDGVVSDHLVVARTHNGSESSFWAYRVPNHTYLKVFVPPGAEFVGGRGGVERAIRAPLPYAKRGYTTDPLVVAREETRESFAIAPAFRGFVEYGRRAFATWTETERGKTNALVFDYTHRLFDPVAAGMTYSFVLEKPAGDEGSYAIEITAPVGFRWRENGLPVYAYKVTDPPGRVMFTLTLEAVQLEGVGM